MAAPEQMSLAKIAAMQFVAGGCAGFIEVSIMHPLDLVKTRFQIQRGPEDPNRYTSLADCFRKMYRNEGPLSFYKGILPPLLAETPKRAVKFFTFERYKTLYSYGSYIPQTMVFTLAGLSSGLTEAFVINPFEAVKVRLQAERSQFTEANKADPDQTTPVGAGRSGSSLFAKALKCVTNRERVKKQRSTYATAREIVRENGFGTKGLNKGITATLGRHGVFNMIYFGCYHNIKAIVPEANDSKLELLRRFTIGLCSGVLGSVINIPFDVAKSRIQGPQPVPGEVKYRACFATIMTVYREEGFFALYKGLLPKILRLGPGGAIMFLVYEHVFELLQQKF